MISFLTLFLGLIAGVQTVQVSVEARVAAVEFRLDGAAVARSESSPWSAKIDFGAELVPHELVARALDEKGGELGRARQWVNLPRPPAEIEILLERDERGRATSARLTVGSLFSSQPTSLSAAFDGTPVMVAPERRFTVPPYDPETPHLLTVRAEFANAVQSRRDLVLGGGAVGAVSSELTALPVRATLGQTALDRASLSGRFVKDGSPLAVVAVEHGPAEILVVRALSADEAISRLGRGGRTMIDPTRRGVMPIYDPNAMRLEMRLPEEDHVRFIWPRVRIVTQTNPPAELFDSSHEFTAKDGGLYWLLTRVYHPALREAHPRFADAVAIAGLQAVGGHNRRAVILVLGKGTADDSRYAPAVVRRYLAKLRVPLYVWSLEKPPVSRTVAHWEDAEDISTLPKLRAAFEQFRRDLDQQWIVWLEGEHRPQDIALESAAQGIEPLR